MSKDKTQELFDIACQAQSHSYAPYSSFHVGSALVSGDGRIFSGCNVENVSFPVGQCAEATAIGNMVTSGSQAIREILIVSPNQELCPPCGSCRQKIAEFGEPDTLVHLATCDGDITTVKLSELLPLAFKME